MGEDDRLGELVVAMNELKVELGRHAERQAALQRQMDERDQRITERDQYLKEILSAEFKGYLAGQVDSINHNINAIYRELSERMPDRHAMERQEEIERQNAARTRRLEIWVAALTMAFAIMAGVIGIKFPAFIP